MTNRVSRRTFMATAGAVASAAVLGPSLFDVQSVLAGPLFVRRDIGGLTAADSIIVSYRKAVKAMQALPDSNPLSWAYQAAIHGTVLSPPKTAWNTCEHGTDFFWSWHRMYLYWFEKIIRKMSGDYGWALPYWNWTSPSERQLPPMFRDPSSELYTVHRNSAINTGAGSLPASDVTYSAAFAYLDFPNANGTIQGTPHGDVHVDIGGWMGSVPTAGQDPIFYLHHCNIDRLWDLWLAQGGGRTDPLGDATWKNTKFTFFDENGKQVQMTSCDVLRAAEQLNYKYEGEPPQVNEYCIRFIPIPILIEEIVLLHLPIPEIILSSEPVSVPLEVKEIRQRIGEIMQNKAESLVLLLENVEAEKQPGVVWEVYVGLPEKAAAEMAGPNAAGANMAEPGQNPFYVGNVSLFGTGIRSEAHHEFKPATFRLNITRAVEASLRSNEQVLRLTFVPHGVLIDGKPTRPKVESPVRIGKVSLVLRTEKENPQRPGVLREQERPETLQKIEKKE